MAKAKKTTTAPAAEPTTSEAPSEVTPESVNPETPETVTVEAPAAPAASEPAASDTVPTATDPAPSAEPAAAPESPQAAPPASAENEQPRVDLNKLLDETIDAVQASAAASITQSLDQSQETLEKQAEVEQPQAPEMDRVLMRVAAGHRAKGYFSTSPDCTLSGKEAELNASIFEALQLEGVPGINRQGDVFGWLIRQLAVHLNGTF